MKSMSYNYAHQVEPSKEMFSQNHLLLVSDPIYSVKTSENSSRRPDNHVNTITLEEQFAFYEQSETSTCWGY